MAAGSRGTPGVSRAGLRLRKRATAPGVHERSRSWHASSVGVARRRRDGRRGRVGGDLVGAGRGREDGVALAVRTSVRIDRARPVVCRGIERGRARHRRRLPGGYRRVEPRRRARRMSGRDGRLPPRSDARRPRPASAAGVRRVHAGTPRARGVLGRGTLRQLGPLLRRRQDAGVHCWKRHPIRLRAPRPATRRTSTRPRASRPVDSVH